MDDRILEALRAQAWERAKGELNSLSCASYAPVVGKDAWKEWDQREQARQKLIEDFIRTMEDDELHLA